ncbi:M23 family metallopeptidase [Inquilinus sp. Marseille-Q2685]|uniref:M23 family metallopeptidase n=1 Tax=Inquilinus sp. Marseille-Q2685 TaxID=2866581 RepID=UPI001CE43E52|nr:M23 family metallopeptidase [Inquilinus sp. Marseille-Q2685]
MKRTRHALVLVIASVGLAACGAAAAPPVTGSSKGTTPQSVSSRPPATPGLDSFIVPVRATGIGSPFGQRHGRMHTGIDFRAPMGTPVIAAASGLVEIVATDSGYGRHIVIEHSAAKTLYAHLKDFAPGIRPGLQVKQGQTIGYVGRSGRATGTHLHFELMKDSKPVDPQLAFGPVAADRQLAQR